MDRDKMIGIEKDIVFENMNCLISFKILTGEKDFQINLTSERDRRENIWSGKFVLNELQKENNAWNFFFDIEVLYDALSEVVQENNFTLTKEGENLLFIFQNKFMVGKKEISHLFNLILKKEERKFLSSSPNVANIELERKVEELTQRIAHLEKLPDQLAYLYSEFQSFKEKTELTQSQEFTQVKDFFFRELQGTVDENSKIKTKLEELNKKLDGAWVNFNNIAIPDIKKERAIDINDHIGKRFEKYSDIFGGNNIVDPIQKNINLNEAEVLFQADQKLPEDKFYFNQNKVRIANNTIDKVIDCSWTGVMIMENIPTKGMWKYSVQVKKSEGMYILIGIGLKGENNSRGYSNANCYMFYLSDKYNFFYNKGNGHQSVNIGAKNGDVFTVVIDMDFRSTWLLKNNFMIGSPMMINYQELQIGNLYPCIDLWNKGDSVVYQNLSKC
jgi:hypothetical protein